MNFQTETFGKWILAGEHAVLRGAPALVFPTGNYSMKFSYFESNNPLSIQFDGRHGEDLKLIFWGLVECALEKSNKTRADLLGRLIIESTIPLGAGLGASAALCVGLVRFFIYLGWVQDNNLYEFSRQLEGIFHGESSGVDIAVAIENKGLRFMRGGERSFVKLNWKPNFYLSYSGERGVTADCVKRVNDLRAISAHLGSQIDDEMREAVELAEKAICADPIIGKPILVESMNLACECFNKWGLTSGSLENHMQELRRNGAIAVKPTGSGGGGYVLSLWDASPPHEIQNQLVKIFKNT